jgi:hypothetical protein
MLLVGEGVPKIDELWWKLIPKLAACLTCSDLRSYEKPARVVDGKRVLIEIELYCIDSRYSSMGEFTFDSPPEMNEKGE